MDAHYQSMYHQATSMQHAFHNYTHAAAYDPAAKVIRNQMHGLTNDIAAGKSLQTIDARMRNIQAQLNRAHVVNPLAPAGQNPIINTNQRNLLHGNFERMRQNNRLHF